MWMWLAALWLGGCTEFEVKPIEPVEIIETLGPVLEISPESFRFSPQMIGCTELATFSLRNVGDETLTIEGVSMEEGTHFTIVQPPGLETLEPGDETSVVVSFIPEETPPYSDWLKVLSNDRERVREAGVYGSTDDRGTCQELRVTRKIRYEAADIAFILDTTYSMDALTSAVSADLLAIASELETEIDDITFGLASFRDYAYHPLGRVEGDFPFHLEMQQTSDLSLVKTALGSLAVDGGGDLTESGIEALYQAATGNGYDQDCDRLYTAGEDVLPFLSQKGDVFRGTEVGSWQDKVPDSGTVGGMGFREGILPILIIGTDDRLRDPSAGDPSPEGCYDAQFESTKAALEAINAKVIGVVVNHPEDSEYVAQMKTIADKTISWYSGSEDFQPLIVTAIRTLVTQIFFDRVWLEVVGDDLGLLAEITPSEWEKVDYGQVVSFVLTTTDNAAIVNDARPGETTSLTIEMHGEKGEQSWLLEIFTVHVLF